MISFRTSPKATWYRLFRPDAVWLSREPRPSSTALKELRDEGFVAQLLDDGLAEHSGDAIRIAWANLYIVKQDESYGSFVQALELPAENLARPVMRSTGSYTDRTFTIALEGWRDERRYHLDCISSGAIVSIAGAQFLLSQLQWSLLDAVRNFADRPDEQRDEDSNRLLWGAIRELALKANAQLDDFLYRSVVLTPAKLNVGMRRSNVGGTDRLVELIPSFAEAPENWLSTFDSRSDVPERYDIVTSEGIVQVMISKEVRTVLQEIKRLPARRVAGARAEAFILNPYATLGPDANAVIDEGDFERARASAGLRYERFCPKSQRDGSGRLTCVGILIESSLGNGPATSELRWMEADALREFIGDLDRSLSSGHQLLAWEGFDFELSGEAPAYLRELQSLLDELLNPPPLVAYAQVHDLSSYSTRIEGIGVEKRYYSPFIAKRKDENDWVPENVVPMVVYQPDGGGEPIAVPTTEEAIDKLRTRIDQADKEGLRTVEVSWLPRPLPISDAREIVDTFGSVFTQLKKGTFEPEKAPRNGKNAPKPKSLVLRANIQALEYEEKRRTALNQLPSAPVLPSLLRPDTQLKEHQLQGLAWLQHLYNLRETYQVRGAVLADDMGLGKTLQILSLIAWLFEFHPKSSPVLVVAPVSLLENWASEAKRFFRDGALPILTAYGEKLAPLRVSREQIDRRLRDEDGLVKFLKPGWVGQAKVVLTTYETLRDLQFSFAAQSWSLMVCDEAQKIKNAAAMVTRAAKKQNVAFKIACTGTPVENTLADLWCLFDFVQPGLLGALNDFGQRYRRPIEAKTDEERARVDELRGHIQPQILRRLKADVAKDLPAKLVVDSCRRLPLSAMQRTLYANAVSSFKKRGDPGEVTPFKNHLGLLHYLRLICTDPKPHGLTVFKPEATSAYRKKAPKLDWLLRELSVIQARGEKAIVFCEFREIQRLLRHYIEAEFNYGADIINGESATSRAAGQSRQKRIDAFQSRPGFGVIILSPLAVGFGVNIQGANHVIHYTRTWNPAKEDQATDRAYRIGQTKDVYVYYPVVTADDFITFDVKLDQLLARKRELAGDMLNGAGDVLPGDFDVSEVIPGGSMSGIDSALTLEHALQMEWRHFECLAGVLWSKQGYRCYRTPASGDNGVDVVALSDVDGFLIQTKTASRDGQRLGWEAVKDVVTGAAYYQARHPGVVFRKACVTNQYFNEQAKANAVLNQVELFERADLERLLRKHPVTMLEVERLLYAEWAEA